MKEVPCNLCGENRWKVLYPSTFVNSRVPDVEAFRCTSAGYGTHPQIVTCLNCGFVYANPRWDSSELLAAYAAVEDEIYLKEQVGRRQTFAKHLRSLERFTGEARGRLLLDVGAYIGIFVDVACEAGWNALGVEPSEWAATVAKGKKLPVLLGTLELDALQSRSFDVITMWDVIEHFDDPKEELKRVFALLNPGGYIAIHTMDIDSLLARILGRRWPWLMDMHIHYFSQDTLAEMLRQCGFEVIWAGAQGRYLSMGYLASRVEGINKLLGRLSRRLVHSLSLDETTVPVNFGDLFTIYARRPPEAG